MKKIIVLLMSIAMVFGLCACGGPSPTDNVDAFLQAVKAEDSEAAAALYAGEDIDVTTEFEDDDSASAEMNGLIEGNLKTKLLDFDYELSNEAIDGDKATVDVKITTYSIGDAFTSFATDYFAQAFTMAMSGASEDQLNSLAETLLTEKITALKSKDYEKTVTIALTQNDGDWIIDEFEKDGDFYNAITGGMIDAAADIADAYSFDE